MLPMAPHPPVIAADETQKDTTPYPVVVSTSPKNGDLEVDPNLKVVSVTFDRDMSTGMSWTGSEVPVDESRKASWKDKRTCELPVKLAKGQGYVIGINAPSFKNFKSQAGEPTPPTAIYFATKGASSQVKQKVTVPKIVSMEPANGAKDVDPALKQLKVTFDVPMGGGMSWVGGGEFFPTIPDGQRGTWSEDRRTCTLPVSLQPGHTYKLGINAPRFRNFQSESQVPADPMTYSFTTRK
jgi:hypothetical protein